MSAAFDNDPSRIGTSIGGIKILDAATMESVLATERAELAILAVPAEHASEIATRLVNCKISGILNFAPTTLRLTQWCRGGQHGFSQRTTAAGVQRPGKKIVISKNEQADS